MIWFVIILFFIGIVRAIKIGLHNKKWSFLIVMIIMIVMYTYHYVIWPNGVKKILALMGIPFLIIINLVLFLEAIEIKERERKYDTKKNVRRNNTII